MRSFWSDPYLWIHLTGLAAFPLFLEGCLVGFAAGDPLFPVWLELLLVATVGIAPILWMQWQRPFYIFSLVAVSVKPEALTDDQRRLLTLFKLPRHRVIAVLVAVVLMIVLRTVYEVAPIAAPATSFLFTSHWLGLLLAAVAFLSCNLFVQVPISVASVMFSSQSAFAATLPYPLETIRRSFTLVGLQLNQIVPPMLPDAQPPFATEQAKASQVSATDAIAATTQATSSVEPLTSALWVTNAQPTIGTSTNSELEAVATDDAVTTSETATAPPEQEMPDAESSSEPESSQP